MTGVHIKSINVQDILIQRSFSTATGNLVRLPIAVEKDLAVLYTYGRVLLLIAAMLLTLFVIGAYIPNCMYVFMSVHACNTVNYVPVQLDSKQP